MTIGRIPSVEGGIQPTIVDAKGDLIAATAADTVNRLAVGSNDQVLVADSSATTGLAWKSYGAQFVAGKNKIINGDFGVWQRGTTFTFAGGDVFTADRFVTRGDGPAGTPTVTRQTFTPGTAPVAGYEGQYFLRYTTGGNVTLTIAQTIEDVRTLAGQTITMSFWMKTSTPKTFTMLVRQSFGTGGSAIVDQTASYTTTTSWQRFSQTFTLGSMSGKTIGPNSFVLCQPIAYSAQTGNFDIDIWGVQFEAGSVATPFTTATGTIQGELAACQRYFYNINFQNTTRDAYNTVGMGFAQNTTNGYLVLTFPTSMRIAPTSLSYTGPFVLDDGVGAFSVTNLTINQAGTNSCLVNATSSGLTAYRPVIIYANGNTSARLSFSAEL